MVAPFKEVQFPTDISYGSTGGPGFLTIVAMSASGDENRNINWDQARAKYNAKNAVKKITQVAQLIAIFRVMHGRGYGFRYKDWLDFSSRADGQSDAVNFITSNTDQLIGTGDGTSTLFQIIKTYTYLGQTYVRTIKRPVQGTIKLSIGGVAKTETTDYTVDYTTGIVTILVPPGVGVLVKVGYEFDVPVRFDTDDFNASIDDFLVGSIDIPLIEVRT